MIRILHFIPAFGMGGVESLIMGLYRTIDREKIQFDFLVETEEKRKEFDEIAVLGGRVYRLGKLNKKNPFSYIHEVKNFFKAYAFTFEAVHCHHIERATLVLYYAKKHQIDLRIIHAHTDNIDDIKFSTLRKGFMRINNYLSTSWVACSHRAGEFQFGKDKKPFIVLKNAIDTSKFIYSKKYRQKMREQFLYDKNTFLIGHTGRFTYPKNHWKIIDVFAKVYKKYPQAKLLLVGDGPLREEMEEKVNNLYLDDAVYFLGERDDISDLLQMMDVFILPSFYEGFCISLLEAQSTGLKCVTSDVIPREVEVTNLITKLGLDVSDDVWAEKTLQYKEYQRVSYVKEIEKHGYGLVETSRWLMDFYLKGMERRKV